MGDYTGGELGIDGVGLIDVNGVVVKFNGHVKHWSEPYYDLDGLEGGERYTLVGFTHNKFEQATVEQRQAQLALKNANVSEVPGSGFSFGGFGGGRGGPGGFGGGRGGR